jgi:hypothetical protein
MKNDHLAKEGNAWNLKPEGGSRSVVHAATRALYASLGFRPVASECTDDSLFMEAPVPPSPRWPDRAKLA